MEEFNPFEDSPRTASDKCIDCTAKHLYAALGHLQELVDTYGFTPEYTCPVSAIAYERALINLAEAQLYDGSFVDLALTRLQHIEDLITVGDEAYNVDDALYLALRNLRKDAVKAGVTLNVTEFTKNLKEVRNCVGCLPAIGTPMFALYRAIAHLREAMREMPYDVMSVTHGEQEDLRELWAYLYEKLISLTTENKTHELDNAIAAIQHSLHRLRLIKGVFSGDVSVEIEDDEESGEGYANV